jgi:hypothetical protein
MIIALMAMAIVMLYNCSTGLAKFQTALASAFPDCQDLKNDPSCGISHFVPHLAVGQFKSAEAAEAAAKVTIHSPEQYLQLCHSETV